MTSHSDLAAFNPSNKTDVLADYIRIKMASFALAMFSNLDFRALDTAQQIEVMTGGVLTGLMGALHSFIVDTTEGHDEIERFVTSYVSQARHQAEGIAASGETRQ